MKRAAALLLIAFTALPAAAAVPPSDPGFWFDRAAADIASIPAHPKTKAMLSSLDLAGMLVEDRGSDADRRLLRSTLDHYEPVPNPDPALRHAYYALNAAYARALLGDRREAASLADDARTSVPDTAPGVTRLFIDTALAMVYARLGDDDRAVDLSARAGASMPFLGKTYTYAELSKVYDDLGKKSLADKSRHLAESAARQSKDDVELVGVISLYARAGDYPAAVKLLDALPNDFHRSDALVKIARAQRHAGLKPQAAGTLRRAADVLSKSESADCPDCFWKIAQLAAEWHDKRLFLDLAPLVERALETNRRMRSYCLPELAQGYAAVGDLGSYHRLAALAAAEPVTGEYAKNNTAIRDVLLAAARARSGDVDAAMSALDRVIRSRVLADYQWDEYGYAVPEALVDAGRFDEAYAAARKVFSDPEKFSHLHQEIAGLLSDAGRYDDAWTTAAKVYFAHRRVALFRRIAAAELSVDPLAARRHVDSIQIPWERAMTNLGVAESLAHIPPTGRRHLFDTNHDDR
jgi:tetratricopeptide (TPR) repeat protein